MPTRRYEGHPFATAAASHSSEGSMSSMSQSPQTSPVRRRQQQQQQQEQEQRSFDAPTDYEYETSSPVPDNARQQLSSPACTHDQRQNRRMSWAANEEAACQSAPKAPRRRSLVHDRILAIEQKQHEHAEQAALEAVQKSPEIRRKSMAGLVANDKIKKLRRDSIDSAPKRTSPNSVTDMNVASSTSTGTAKAAHVSESRAFTICSNTDSKDVSPRRQPQIGRVTGSERQEDEVFLTEFAGAEVHSANYRPSPKAPSSPGNPSAKPVSPLHRAGSPRRTTQALISPVRAQQTRSASDARTRRHSLDMGFSAGHPQDRDSEPRAGGDMHYTNIFLSPLQPNLRYTKNKQRNNLLASSTKPIVKAPSSPKPLALPPPPISTSESPPATVSSGYNGSSISSKSGNSTKPLSPNGRRSRRMSLDSSPRLPKHTYTPPPLKDFYTVPTDSDRAVVQASHPTQSPYQHPTINLDHDGKSLPSPRQRGSGNATRRHDGSPARAGVSTLVGAYPGAIPFSPQLHQSNTTSPISRRRPQQQQQQRPDRVVAELAVDLSYSSDSESFNGHGSSSSLGSSLGSNRSRLANVDALLSKKHRGSNGKMPNHNVAAAVPLLDPLHASIQSSNSNSPRRSMMEQPRLAGKSTMRQRRRMSLSSAPTSQDYDMYQRQRMEGRELLQRHGTEGIRTTDEDRIDEYVKHSIHDHTTNIPSSDSTPSSPLKQMSECNKEWKRQMQTQLHDLSQELSHLENSLSRFGRKVRDLQQTPPSAEEGVVQDHHYHHNQSSNNIHDESDAYVERYNRMGIISRSRVRHHEKQSRRRSCAI